LPRSSTRTPRRRRSKYRLGIASYDADIRPLFRERDQAAMLSHFDLWSYDDVTANADAILDQLASGSMPCDAWPSERAEIFRAWVADGTPA
jgi:hypothetical protein